MMYIFAQVVSYLLGSISPAIILGKINGINIKEKGSGNAGATNTLRVLGKKAAIITLIVDILKGVLAVILARLMAGDQAAYLACTFVILGHIFPVWFGFKGGKGVAVAFGALTAINPYIGLACLAVVAVTVLLSRAVSLGSILAALSVPVWSVLFEPAFLPYVIFPALLVVFMHRTNIKRILSGQENKLWK